MLEPKPFNVGLVLSTMPTSGGAGSFETNLLRIVKKQCEDLNINLNIFVPKSLKHPNEFLTYSHSKIRQLFAHLRANFFLSRLLVFTGLGKSQLERRLISKQIDLAIFSSPNHLSAGLSRVPIVTTAWDFGHVDLPFATETSLDGIWWLREHLYRSTLRRSTFILADSNATSRRLVSEFNVPERKVVKIGLLPEAFTRTAKKSNRIFSHDYLVYPALFWPHKNHEILIKALARYLREGSELHLVFTGTGSNMEKVKQLTRQLGIENYVHFMGFVSREELSELIVQSRGLVMPSLLGPSNLPPLEAALSGVASVISDVHDMEDLLEGYVDVPATNVDSWEKAIRDLQEGKIEVAKVVDLKPDAKVREMLETARELTAAWRNG